MYAGRDLTMKSLTVPTNPVSNSVALFVLYFDYQLYNQILEVS